MLHRLSIPVPVVLCALLAVAGCKKGDDDVFYGDEAAFEGIGTSIESAAPGAFNPGTGKHDPNEPAVFSAGWAGMEAYEVLQAAKRKDLALGQVKISTGEPCLVFHQNKLVRRMVIGTGRVDEPTREMTFSAAGGLVLWFYSNRQQPPTYSWAYFHQNSRLALFQIKYPGEQRQTTQAPGVLPDEAYAHANDCLRRFGATNPAAGEGVSGGGAAPGGGQAGPGAAPGSGPGLGAQPASQPAPAQPQAQPGVPQRSASGGAPVKVKFINWRPDDVRMVWIDQSGQEKNFGKILADHNVDMDTYVGHVWVFRSEKTGQEVARFAAGSPSDTKLDIR